MTKFCSECRFFVPAPTLAHSRCSNALVPLNAEDGDRFVAPGLGTSALCSIARKYTSECGPEAKFFEAVAHEDAA